MFRINENFLKFSGAYLFTEAARRRKATFRGYPFLKQRIIQQDFAPYGVNLTEDEVYINDGAKSDLGNLGDIFAADNVIAVPDPAYPAYVDANVIYSRCGTYVGGAMQWDRVVYLP